MKKSPKRIETVIDFHVIGHIQLKELADELEVSEATLYKWMPRPKHVERPSMNETARYHLLQNVLARGRAQGYDPQLWAAFQLDLEFELHGVEAGLDKEMRQQLRVRAGRA